ncbi:MAG: PLDc N-terminal domain-containing protein [Humibacillus sp.]|nr:PLDc N-terminal domain-containing protein [Humibacillus sp.]MDN5775766.1 PLDc N-terminal domain-containing protein [Humibacillus sp.]
MEKKKWSDLTGVQQKAIVVAGAVEAVVTAAALHDLARRPASQVRGHKSLWVLAFSVQPFGPLAYFVLGRR